MLPTSYAHHPGVALPPEVRAAGDSARRALPDLHTRSSNVPRTRSPRARRPSRCLPPSVACSWRSAASWAAGPACSWPCCWPCSSTSASTGSATASALRANGARPLQPGEAPELERIVRDLAGRAGIPMPSLHIIDRPEPNAFATGRRPGHAAVAVTTGMLGIMDERQLRGVLAHELSHITNRDMLVGTMAATIGAAVSFLGNMALWSSMFGGGDDDNAAGAADAPLRRSWRPSRRPSSSSPCRATGSTAPTARART